MLDFEYRQAAGEAVLVVDIRLEGVMEESCQAGEDSQG